MKKHIGLLALLIWVSITVQAQTIQNYTTDDGLPDNDVLCLTNDEQGNMWFGTQNGVAKFDGLTWSVFNTTSHPDIPHNTITAIAQDKDGDIWIGTDFGVSVFDGTDWTTYTTTEGIGHNRVNHIMAASNGDVWISDFNGATVYDGSTFQVFGSSNGLPFGGVNYCAEDKNGDILMGTGIGGLAVYDGSSFNTYSEAEGLVSNVVNAIAVDNAGNRWIGTANGITVLDASGNWVKNYTQMLTIPAPDTLNPVEDIKIDDFGNVWVGIYVDYLVTVGGVVMFDGTSWTEYDASNGLAGPTVRKLILDTRGNAWVGTSSGVSKIDNPLAGVEEIARIQSVKIYPNPAQNIIDVEIIGLDGKLTTVAIYDASMRIVGEASFEYSFEKFSLSVSDLSNGLYYLSIGNRTTRFVVAR